MGTENRFYEKIIDFVFSKDYRKYLIPILIIGIILRYLLVNNVSFLGDEMVHGPHAINIISSNKLGMMQQGTLWFYLTDLAFKIFGVTAFSTRFLSFFFGILTILAVYLLGKEIFDKRAGVVASFLLAISAYTIRYTLIEMDLAMIFFVILATYFFIKGLKKDKISYEAALLLGVATLIKSITIFFVIAFGVAYLYYRYKTAENKKELLKEKDWKQGIIFTSIIFILYSPLLIYNYLLYKDKGIVDVIFSKFLHINEPFYAGMLGVNEGFSIINVFVGAFEKIKGEFLHLDPLIFLIGIIGMLILIKEKNRLHKVITLIIAIVSFLIMTGSDWLSTHFVNFIPFLSIFASSAIIKAESICKKKIKYFLIILLFIIFIGNIFFIPIGTPLINHLTSKSANIQMRDYTIKNIEDNAIVIADSRIYRGRIAWMFNDKFYLESNLLGELEPNIQKSGGKNVVVNLYFIECAIDDCGWGTITNDQFNKTSESIVDLFKNNSPIIAIFNGGGGYNEEKGIPYYNIYKTQITIKPAVYEYIQSTHEWFYYPLNYFKDTYDSYNTPNFFYKILDLIGHIILYFSMIIAILIPLYLFYLLKKDDSGLEEDTLDEYKLEIKINKKWFIYLGILISIIIFIILYINYSNKEIMINHCNTIGLEMYKYNTGELYCLNKTDNSFRAFYYIGKGLELQYKITQEMQLHDQWRGGLK